MSGSSSHVIERAILVARGREVTVADLPEASAARGMP